MKEIVSSIDIELKIPPLFKNFPNTAEQTVTFTAGTPKSVEDYVAEYYTEHRPEVFNYTTSGMSNYFGSSVLQVSTTPIQAPTHALAEWVQFINLTEGVTVKIGGRNVDSADGWAALEAYDSTEKYYEQARNIWLVTDSGTADVRVLWGAATDRGMRKERVKWEKRG